MSGTIPRVFVWTTQQIALSMQLVRLAPALFIASRVPITPEDFVAGRPDNGFLDMLREQEGKVVILYAVETGDGPQIPIELLSALRDHGIRYPFIFMAREIDHRIAATVAARGGHVLFRGEMAVRFHSLLAYCLRDDDC